MNGLMYQYYTAENGDMVVKYFFPENRIAGSMTATLTQSPGNFTIKSLEDTNVLEYDFMEFKKLVAISKYKDWTNFGQAPKGRILLQDHGDKVSFRTLKIRSL